MCRTAIGFSLKKSWERMSCQLDAPDRSANWTKSIVDTTQYHSRGLVAPSQLSVRSHFCQHLLTFSNGNRTAITIGLRRRKTLRRLEHASGSSQNIFPASSSLLTVSEKRGVPGR